MDRTALNRRIRRSSRIALYGSLAAPALLIALGALFLSFQRPKKEKMAWLGIDYGQIPEVQLLQRYLRLNTAQPNADERSGAEFLAGILREHGIPATIEIVGKSHANLIAILEGQSKEALVLHNHIDTDPVDTPEEWTHGPFSGDIAPPYIYGRGAYDMKGIAIAQLAALLELKKSGVKPRRSVIFLATGTEEVGSDLGMKWILTNHPELKERFWALLTEGGVVETLSTEEPFYWGIEVAQKRFVDVMLCSDSRERLDLLGRELYEERRNDNFEVRPTKEVVDFLQVYGPTRFRQDFRRWLASLDQLRLDAPAFEELPIYLKAMFRDEAVAFPIQEQPGGGFSMKVKLHLLPGSDAETVRRRFLPEWRVAGLDVAVFDERGAEHGSPIDHEVYRTTAELLTEAYPGIPIGPHFLPRTATDSRFVRAAGIPAYGLSPFLIYTPETARIGLIDERLQLPGFLTGVDIYKKLVQRLAG